MNQHGYSGDKEMLETCIEALRLRPGQGIETGDGPTVAQLEHLVRDLDLFFCGPAQAEVLWVARLHKQLVEVSNSWKFPECDPVAGLLMPYLFQVEAEVREILSGVSPEIAEMSQKIMSLAIATRCMGRVAIEQKERKERRQALRRAILRRLLRPRV